MLQLLLPITLSAALLPTLITAQCAACDSYSAALTKCQTTSANITAVGSMMDTTSIKCMCVSSSSKTQMNTCQGCEESDPSTIFDVGTLLAWTMTCTAYGNWGDQQAVACWEGQPSNDLPCFEKTGAGNSIAGSGITTSAMTSASSQIATTAPTTSTTVKSDGVVPLQAFGMVSIMIVGLGMVNGV